MTKNQKLNDYFEEIDEDDEDVWFEGEIPWLDEKPKWWERVISLFHKKRTPTVEKTEEPIEDSEEWNKHFAVAACIEAALSSTKWHHRDLDRQAPNMVMFYVVNVGIRDNGYGGFTLYVGVKDNVNGEFQAAPLHEFLKDFFPAEELTFSDYHA